MMTQMLCGTLLEKYFFQCVDKHAPLCTKHIRASKSSWITPQLKRRMHYKDVLKVKAILSANACNCMHDI